MTALPVRISSDNARPKSCKLLILWATEVWHKDRIRDRTRCCPRSPRRGHPSGRSVQRCLKWPCGEVFGCQSRPFLRDVAEVPRPKSQFGQQWSGAGALRGVQGCRRRVLNTSSAPSTKLPWDVVVPIYSLSLLSVNRFRSARSGPGRALSEAERTLDGEDRSGTVDREGKGIWAPLPTVRPTLKPEEPKTFSRPRRCVRLIPRSHTDERSCVRPARLASVISVSLAPSNPPPIGIDRVPCLLLAAPSSSSAIRLADVGTNLQSRQVRQYFVAVVTLVSHHFRDPRWGHLLVRWLVGGHRRHLFGRFGPVSASVVVSPCSAPCTVTASTAPVSKSTACSAL